MADWRMGRVRLAQGVLACAGREALAMVRDGTLAGVVLEDPWMIVADLTTDIQALSHKPEEHRPEHSPLGASGAERWMECPGSVALIRELRGVLDSMDMSEEDDPDYRREGTAMHHAAEHCLTKHLDTWEIVGQTFHDTVIDEPMADAIQGYLDRCRALADTAGTTYVEYGISSPIHPLFYGRADFVAVGPDHAWIAVRDLKGGEGIIVEVEMNAQQMYYAYGVIDGIERSRGTEFPDDTPVSLGVDQPRAFHPDGEPLHTWDTTVGEIKSWVHSYLLPAMVRTEMDGTLDAGDHCRFCPAKLVCPLLTSLFKAAATCNPKEVINYDDASIARSWKYSQGVKFYLRALEEEAFRRLNLGRAEAFEGVAKLVPKKSWRVFKSEAVELAKAQFGDDAFTKPVLKGPAELEKFSPAARDFVKEHAYHPDTGVTIAPWSDNRPAIRVKSSKEAFAASLAAMGLTAPE
jgi:hypothetical protein